MVIKKFFLGKLSKLKSGETLDRVQKGVGVIKKSKKSQVSEATKNNNSFSSYEVQKHKILSNVVLNMSKYTIISLILIDFVPIFFIFNLFRRMFSGSFRS